MVEDNEEKVFIELIPGPNVIKHFTADNFFKAIVFIISNSLQPNLIFVGKAKEPALGGSA